jgi:hypothetical protein
MPLQLLQIILPQASVAAPPEALGASDASANSTATADKGCLRNAAAADTTATTPDPLLQPETEAVAQSEMPPLQITRLPQIMLLQQQTMPILQCHRHKQYCHNAATAT